MSSRPDEPFQFSDHQPARLVEFLLFNDVQVEQASKPLRLDGIDYPPAPTSCGWTSPSAVWPTPSWRTDCDLSDLEGLTSTRRHRSGAIPCCGASHRVVMEDDLDIPTTPVTAAVSPMGSVETAPAGAYGYLPTSLASIRATNDLLARGAILYRAPGPFADRGRDFGAGIFFLPADQEGVEILVHDLADGYGLDVLSLDGLPAGAVPMRPQQVAVVADAATRFLLEGIGFSLEAFSVSDLNRGPDLTRFDLLINASVHLGTQGLSRPGRQVLQDYFAAGGDYVGLGTSGARLANDASLLDVSYQTGPGNSIVQVDPTIRTTRSRPALPPMVMPL